jgi:hypothetical protein
MGELVVWLRVRLKGEVGLVAGCRCLALEVSTLHHVKLNLLVSG